MSINKIENEKTIPNLKLAMMISQALDKCLYEVFDLDGTGKYQCPCSKNKCGRKNKDQSR